MKMRITVAAIFFTVGVHAATVSVRVNADGSFTPSTVTINSGDTIQWTFSSSSDSIIPINWDGASSGYCSAVRAWSADDFTGPMPQAVSGIFTISQLGAGYVVETARSTCASGQPPVVTVGSQMLCRSGAYEATLNDTWQDPSLSGVFIRLLWSDVQKAPGTADSSFDFTVMDREITQAVKNGKVYSLGVKAGNDGTPAWLFTNGITELKLQDSGSSDPDCGPHMSLGNPTEPAYQNAYFDLLRKVAAHIKSRADWYRALAFIKVSGANLFSHENRLPKRCSPGCICNTQVFAQNGYTPNGLYAFYQAQADLLAAEFPGKTMNYALIQDGFPQVNNNGDYEKSDGTSSGGKLPGVTEQTQTIMDNGQAAHGLAFSVAHNGLQVKRSDNCLTNRNGAGCPNKFVLQEGAEGQVTGFQTVNDLAGSANTDSALQNALQNSQGIYVELYEDDFWEAVHQPNGVLDPFGSGLTMSQWATEFQNRRLSLFPTLPNPFPTTYSHTFTTTFTQTLRYIHGSKCGIGNATPGTIIVTGSAPAPVHKRAAKH